MHDPSNRGTGTSVCSPKVAVECVVHKRTSLVACPFFKFTYYIKYYSMLINLNGPRVGEIGLVA